MEKKFQEIYFTMATDMCNVSKVENDFKELVNTVGEESLLTSKEEDEKDLLSGTLEACLKVLLQQKSATEDKLVTSQEELALVKERVKKLEHAVKGRGAKAKEFAKKLSEITKEKASLLVELKLCHEQLKEELEKKLKLQTMYTESLKLKNFRIKELETENEALKQSRKASAMAGENQTDDGSVFHSSQDHKNVTDTKPSFHSDSFESSDQENPIWDPFFGGVKVSQDNLDGMVDNYDMLQLSYTEALRAKNDRIKQLELDFQMLKSSRLMSMSQISNYSSDLSFDSYQSDAAFSNSYSSSNLLSSSADSTRLTLPLSSLRSNRSFNRHARSQSLTDRETRLKSLPDQPLRKPRLNSLRLQNDSFESLSPGSSPTNSGSVTPTSLSGSYSGVLGKGLQSLSHKVSELKKKSEPRLQSLATDDHTVSKSASVKLRMRNEQQRKEGTKVSTSSHYETSSKLSSSKETKQTRRYMTKRQREQESRSNNRVKDSHDLPLPAEIITTSTALSTECPIIHISSEKTDVIPNEKTNGRSKNNNTSSKDEENSIHQSESIPHGSDDEEFIVEFSSIHSKPSSYDEGPSLDSQPASHSRFSSLTSQQAKIMSECPTSEPNPPQWKKELIQKRKTSGSSFKQQPVDLIKNPPNKPEWMKALGKKVSVKLLSYRSSM